MEAIRGKCITIDKRAKIPDKVAKAVQMLCGHKVTLILDGDNVKIVAVEENVPSLHVSGGKQAQGSLGLIATEVN